ncbi:hypothetical protein AGMMS50239_27700 [Bacteroidia bacterium]|nr:hypothetical protein AGMMS50239_27700 [Bacteroidia bacterium]
MAIQQRIKDVGEVFTPQHIVNDMVDLLPDLQIATTVLEPSVGEGVFLCEILRRKLNSAQDFETVRIALQTLYGVDIMLDNVRKTRENLLEICKDTTSKVSPEQLAILEQILKNNIRWGDTLACFEAKSEDNENVLCLKDKREKDVQDLQFFNYQKNKWENYFKLFCKAMKDEIVLQRNEYRNPPTQQSLSF